MTNEFPELAAKVQAFIEWLRSTPCATLADEIVYRPVDPVAYERLFEQLGFALPHAWREWVQACGLLQVPALAELPTDE